VGDLVFARRFLQDLAEFEGSHSPRDIEAVERALGAIATDPTLPGRVPSFYDPMAPSFLYRAGGVLVHYRVTASRVEFLNLFFRRL
jgi:hypothetical protein